MVFLMPGIFVIVSYIQCGFSGTGAYKGRWGRKQYKGPENKRGYADHVRSHRARKLGAES
ncbi:hypothetical protein [Vibrio mangrovi]|uniref:Uncharacterized protein n=1 Tax=Vibrio mangrovi TaxID=474394 RepID=A0A1Y6IQ31_9VIBR|nr:hypothetical protein [Vibrio mangrovi]SMR99736.1 hypothetical protein VIM7927_00967 [Vibrio mangrovi]